MKKQRGQKAPGGNQTTHCRASVSYSSLPKAPGVRVTWCFKALGCCWWNESAAGHLLQRRLKLKKWLLPTIEPHRLRQEKFKMLRKAPWKFEQMIYFRRLDWKKFKNIPSKYTFASAISHLTLNVPKTVLWENSAIYCAGSQLSI